MESPKVRPYWHVDAKWICGLLAIPVISAWLFGFGLFRLTQADQAPAFASNLIQSVFSDPSADVQVKPEELKRQLAPLYEQGPKGVAKAVSNDPIQQAKLEKQLSTFGIFTRDYHNKLGIFLIAWAILSLLVMTGLIFFSHRFGKLVSLGVVLVSSSLLGAALAGTVSTGSGDNGVRIAVIGPSVLRLAGQNFLPAYLVALGLGLILLLAAAVLKAIKK